MSDHSFVMFPLKSVIHVTKLVTVLSYELSPSFSNRGERHNFWEMVYVDRGKIYCNADGEERLLRQGEIIFHKPNEFHSVTCDGARSASVFILTFECRSPAMRSFYDKSFKMNTEEMQLMRRMIAECNRTFAVSEYPLRLLENAPIGGAQLIRNYLEEFLIHALHREQSRGEENGEQAIRSATDSTLAQEICDYLRAHVCDRITLEDISERFHFGKSRICDLFKRAQKDTIVGYHTKLKIAEAKRLLFEKKHTVGEIAEYLGFESPEYFSRVFRRHTGQSPRSFRTSLVSGDNTRYLERELRLGLQKND